MYLTSEAIERLSSYLSECHGTREKDCTVKWRFKPCPRKTIELINTNKRMIGVLTSTEPIKIESLKNVDWVVANSPQTS